MSVMIALLHRLGLQNDPAARAFETRLSAMARRQMVQSGRPSPFRFSKSPSFAGL